MQFNCAVCIFFLYHLDLCYHHTLETSLSLFLLVKSGSDDVGYDMMGELKEKSDIQLKWGSADKALTALRILTSSLMMTRCNF